MAQYIEDYMAKARKTAEIELHVRMFNLSYRLEGFQAISELKDFLDDHATEVMSPSATPSLFDDPSVGALLADPLFPTRTGGPVDEMVPSCEGADRETLTATEIMYGNQAPQYPEVPDEVVEEMLNEKMRRIHE